MKTNHSIAVLIILAVVTLFAVSCKKDISVKPEDQPEKTILEFKTVDHYAQFIEKSETEREIAIKEMIAVQDHPLNFKKTSARKNTPQDVAVQEMMNDEFMSSILNDDWIVQIGNYLYRINPTTESVFVLHADYKDEYYNDLASEHIENDKITVYSTTENVIELVENKIKPKALFCKENGCGARNSMTPPFNYGSSAWGAEFELAHRKFGIYFKISANVYSKHPSRYDIYFERCIFKPTCVSATDRSNSWVTNIAYSGGANNCFQHKIYDGMRNLNKYHIKGYALCPSSPLGPQPSSTIEIRIGY